MPYPTVMKVLSFEEGGVNLPEGTDPQWDMPKARLGVVSNIFLRLVT